MSNNFYELWIFITKRYFIKEYQLNSQWNLNHYFLFSESKNQEFLINNNLKPWIEN